MTQVAHLTSVHPRYDTRIFLKECTSLAGSGYDVHLVVADGYGDAYRNGVHIHDVGPSIGRLDRMRNAALRVFVKAIALEADVYHLHDPELMPIGIKLKRRGKTVVFDAHEDLPKQLLSKPYLAPGARRLISWTLGFYERWACRRYDGVVAATPSIGAKFQLVNPQTVTVNNYPLVSEFENKQSWQDKKAEVCYIGGISEVRGILRVCAAMGMIQGNVRLNLAGAFSEPEVETRAKTAIGWSKVNQLGFLDRQVVCEVLGRSIAGIVTFLPVPNHIEAQPNKMFEYMCAGIPVIASDFPRWREIVEGNDCGILVDPNDPIQIAAAIDTLVANPELAQRMGENGRRAVEVRFNWEKEERALLDFYRAME